ncbi:putative P450 monooxygenase [Zymoseptoria tritici IPO323]|uniref:P450 monooxygenase n=1 Tax=Zymoseptoria tritici (strain CBS 115943 / IPO323) TaxID=336722 RepID=F9XJU1_ZYMTI|nr:putative P450 monooxygenase [Zymoseptoria tritici IPO323]EGP84247.1 putative P450 monooxygenase [Zymoseptoria tritici IPO323]
MGLLYATGVVLVLLTFAWLVRRRRRDGLRHIPGPWINTVSPFAFPYQVVKGFANVYLYALHEKYGPVVRIGPNEVSFAGPALEAIYGLRKGGALEKSRAWLGGVSPWKGFHGLGIARGDEHRRQRRALAPSMSKAALKSQEGIIQENVGQLMDRLRAEAAKSEDVNVAEWFTYFTFDMMGDVCLNQSFGCLDLGERTDWADSIIDLHISSSWLTVIQQIAGMETRFGRLLSKVLARLFVPRQLDKSRKLHFQKTMDATVRRMEAESSHPDAIYHILRSNKEDRIIAPREEIILNMTLFLSAGSETTSILLTTCSWLLISHRQVLDRVVREVRSKFQHISEVTLDTVTDAHLPYLHAVIHEAFRLFPPAGTGVGREVPPQGDTITGVYVPGGTTVRVAAWTVQRSAEHFHQPDTFQPERWLKPPPKEFENDRLELSQPFIIGPRQCLGAPLVMFESQLALSRLLLQFDISAPVTRRGIAENEKWNLSPTIRSIESYTVIKKPNTWVNLRPVPGMI